MQRHRFDFTLGLLICSALAGCAPSPGSDVPNISDLCGTRTADTLPPPGTLRSVTRTVVTFQSSGSALEKIIRSFPDVFPCPAAQEPVIRDYVVDTEGRILSIDGAETDQDETFVIAEGCLQIRSAQPSMAGRLRPDTTDPNASWQAAQEVRAVLLSRRFRDRHPSASSSTGTRQSGSSTICADNAFPITRSLEDDFDPVTDPYVCVRLLEGESCQDCDDADGGWTFRTRTTLIFTALGGLTEVQTRDVCTDEEDVVNLRLGEEVRVTLAIETRFEPVTD